MSFPVTSEYAFRNYLTRQQKDKYQDLDPRLQRIVEGLIMSGSKEKIQISHLVFDILKICSEKTLHRSVSDFLITLVEKRAKDTKHYLDQTLELIKSGGKTILFDCVSTKKNQYYSREILIEIVDSLHKIYQKNQSFPFLNLPCYDEGGKELLNGSSQVKAQNLLPNGEAINSPLSIKTPSKLSDIPKENCDFESVKSKAIQYLTSLSENDRSTLDLYLKFFRHLQDQNLTEEVKCILTKLIISTTTSKSSQAVKYTKDDFDELFKESQKLCGSWGKEMLESISKAKEFQGEASFDNLIRLLRSLNINAYDFDFNSTVFEYIEGKINLKEILEKLEDQIADSGVDSIEEAEVEDVLKSFKKVEFPLSEDQLETLCEQYKIVKGYCKQWGKYRINQLVELAFKIREEAKKSQLTPDQVLQLVAIGRLAYRIKFGQYAYNTQILTLLGLLNFQKSAIAQVNTGEGKSMIVALLAFVLRMQNNRGHIVSSSHQLSIRDEKKVADFFKIFGSKTSQVCDHQPKAERFQGDIVFGTVADFSFGILREIIFFEKLFPEKLDRTKLDGRFDFVIIDEIDNLTVDTAMNGARLGFLPEISFDWVYYPIHQFVKDNFNVDSKNSSSEDNVKRLKEYLQKHRNGSFLPSLQLLSDEQLKDWIIQAHSAIFKQKKDIDYIVNENKSLQGQVVKTLVIMDVKNTGLPMEGMRWRGGLHEFLEIENGIQIEKESLDPLNLSNPIFYPMHQSCYGLTGTIGSKTERESIKEIYGMESFDVPPHKPSERIDLPTQFVLTNQDKFKKSLERVEALKKEKRPSLVICKNIQESNYLADLLKNKKISFELFNETQKKSGEEIIENAGAPGATTVATNNAGRGTDINLHKDSISNGGLHVILTFYPDSERVEKQARGRAGRQGQPGSSEMILSAEECGFSPLQILILPKDQLELILRKKREEQISFLKHYQRCHALVERYKFKLGSDFYSKLNSFYDLLEDERFLRNRAIVLSDRFTWKKDYNFDHLPSKDRQIATDVFQLLKSGTADISNWESVLKQSIRRIKDKMIADWAVYFYQPIQDLVQKSELEQNIANRNMMEDWGKVLAGDQKDVDQLINEILAESLNESESKLEDSLETLLKDIEKKFEERKSEWWKYLDPSGDGVTHYLREITGLDLKNIGNSSLVKNNQQTQLPFLKSNDNALMKSAQRAYIQPRLPENLNAQNGDFKSSNSEKSLGALSSESRSGEVSPDREGSIPLEDGFICKTLETVGDGSCGIHALLGKRNINRKFAVDDPAKERKDIADWLRDQYLKNQLPNCIQAQLRDCFSKDEKRLYDFNHKDVKEAREELEKIEKQEAENAKKILDQQNVKEGIQKALKQLDVIVQSDNKLLVPWEKEGGKTIASVREIIEHAFERNKTAQELLAAKKHVNRDEIVKKALEEFQRAKKTEKDKIEKEVLAVLKGLEMALEKFESLAKLLDSWNKKESKTIGNAQAIIENAYLLDEEDPILLTVRKEIEDVIALRDKKIGQKRDKILFGDNEKKVFNAYLSMFWENPKWWLYHYEVLAAILRHNKKTIVFEPDKHNNNEIMATEWIDDKENGIFKQKVDLSKCFSSKKDYTFIYYNGINHYERADLVKKA